MGLLGLAIAVAGFDATPAYAHAEVVAATPEAGSGLAQAPGAVVLKFTEPLNQELSSIAVLDRSGRDVGERATRPVPGDERAMRRALGFLRPGTYRVEWTSVSTLDGHALEGSYDFGIGAAPAGAERVRASPVASEGWVGLVGKLLAFGGLALWFGAAVLGDVAVRGGLSSRRLRVLAYSGPGLTLVGSVLSAGSSAYVAVGSLHGLDGVLFTPGSGAYRLLVLVAAVLGVVLTVAWRGWPPGMTNGALASIALVGEAASGHAAATSVPLWATVSLAVHLAAVGVWIFAITAALWSSRIMDAIRAFSAYAIAAAGIVAVTGVVNAVLELHQLGDLTATAYGRVIMLKVAVLVLMGVLGSAHYLGRRRVAPDRRSVRDLVAGELGAGSVALVLAAVLVGFPNPPRQDAAAEALRVPGSLRYIRAADVLSVADGSGPFVVALTVRPARPGPVDVRVQVIGVEPGDGLRDATVRVNGPDGAVGGFALADCGLGCLRGRGEITASGAWRLDTRVTSNRGPIATTATVAFPTPNGARLLEQSIHAMERLRSAQIHEELRSNTTAGPQSARYTFAAPDVFRYAIDGGGAQLQIGRRQFIRDTPTAPWIETPTAPAASDPGFSWPADYFRDIWARPAAVRMIGTRTVDGVTTNTVAFARPEIPAWFQLSIGTLDHLVHRMEMRAEGHLMNHDYTSFNAPAHVTPPTP